MGKLRITQKGYTCLKWTQQKHYPGNHFPEKDLNEADNFCRNPKPTDERTWCYYRVDPNRKWDYCGLAQCGGWIKFFMIDVSDSGQYALLDQNLQTAPIDLSS